MVALTTDKAVIRASRIDYSSTYGNPYADVEKMFSIAKHVQFSPPQEVKVSDATRVNSFDSFDFAGKDIQGTVQCSYAVAGAWNVAAKCELVDKQNDEHMWAGWVFDIRDMSGQASDPSQSPARFRFCFSRELATSKTDFSTSLSELEDKLKDLGPDTNYVCVEGMVDDPNFVSRMASELLSQKSASVEQAVEKTLEESGLFEYQKK